MTNPLETFGEKSERSCSSAATAMYENVYDTLRNAPVSKVATADGVVGLLQGSSSGTIEFSDPFMKVDAPPIARLSEMSVASISSSQVEAGLDSYLPVPEKQADNRAENQMTRRGGGFIDSTINAFLNDLPTSYRDLMQQQFDLMKDLFGYGDAFAVPNPVTEPTPLFEVPTAPPNRGSITTRPGTINGGDLSAHVPSIPIAVAAAPGFDPARLRSRPL